LTLFTAAMTIWANNALYYSPMLPHAWRTFRGGELFRDYRILAFLLLPRRGFTMLGAVLVS
jgi:hypothetical protein